MRSLSKYTALAAAAFALASPAAAQRNVELGVDAGAVFGLGDQSSVSITLPASRFRMGFFQSGSRISIEPAAGLSYNKSEGSDGLFRYNLEVGALYHFSPVIVTTADPGMITSRVTSPYLRPFIGLDGFSGSGSDNEFSVGVGLGTKIPWRRDVALRFEGNVGYGFDREAVRLGLLAGLSFFPR